MASLKIIKTKAIRWTIAKDKNGIYVKGIKYFKIPVKETSAQQLIDLA
jgi:hypothetical protein